MSVSPWDHTPPCSEAACRRPYSWLASRQGFVVWRPKEALTVSPGPKSDKAFPVFSNEWAINVCPIKTGQRYSGQNSLRRLHILYEGIFFFNSVALRIDCHFITINKYLNTLRWSWNIGPHLKRKIKPKTKTQKLFWRIHFKSPWGILGTILKVHLNAYN